MFPFFFAKWSLGGGGEIALDLKSDLMVVIILYTLNNNKVTGPKINYSLRMQSHKYHKCSQKYLKYARAEALQVHLNDIFSWPF